LQDVPFKAGRPSGTIFMRRIIAISAAALLCAGVATADPTDQPGHVSPAPGTSNDTMSAVKDTAGHAVGVVTAEMTTKLPDFVNAAAISDMYEVEAGTIAEQRAQNPKVKAFGEHMVKAHTQTTDKLKSVLASINANVTPPAHLDDRRQGMIDELRGAKDADFDARYIAQQVDAHKEALILIRGYAKSGDNPAVRKIASQTVSLVQSHLNMAERLAKYVK
jgi:putative membrane protein